MSFTVNSFLPYLGLTVKIFQFLRLSTKFLAVLRPSTDKEMYLQHTQLWVLKDMFKFSCFQVMSYEPGTNTTKCLLQITTPRPP